MSDNSGDVESCHLCRCRTMASTSDFHSEDASSILVTCSKCGYGGIGRHDGFRFHCEKHAGSSPVIRTISHCIEYSWICEFAGVLRHIACKPDYAMTSCSISSVG